MSWFGGPIGNATFQRSLMQNSLGAFLGTAEPGNGAWGAVHNVFSAPRQLAGFALHGLAGAGGVFGAAMSGPVHAAGDYMSWRKRASAAASANRRIGDAFSNGSYAVPNAAQAEIADHWGRHLDPEHTARFEEGRFKGWNKKNWKDRMIDGPYKPRKFAMRSPGEHFKQGGKNFLKYSLLSPLAWGLHLGTAALTSNDNLLNVYDGFGNALASSISGELGFMGGSTAGSMLGAAMAPGIGLVAGAGFLAGGLIGAAALAQVPNMVNEFSKFGNRYGRHSKAFRSSFVDSSEAQTMRQRGLQSIYRSQLAARNSMGSESLAYHA